MNDMVRSALVSALVVSVTLAAYHRFVVAPAQRIAIVDIESVIGDRQAVLAEQLVKATSDEQRAAIHSRAAAFPIQIQSAVDALGTECQCLVLDKTVLIGAHPGMLDLTAELKRKVAP